MIRKVAQQGQAILLAMSLAGVLAGTPCQAQSLGTTLDQFSERTYYFLRDTFKPSHPAAPTLYPDEQTGLPVEQKATPQEQNPATYHRQKTYVVGVRG